jgi:mono/diheme cytochrome c family protein
MSWKTFVFGCAVGAAFFGSAAVRADGPAPGSQRRLAAEALGVFSAKCAACHGPDVRKPKGRFGYILDLRRVAANPEMVIPSKPEESELWQLVRSDEMPPPDAPSGALTAAQKEAVRAWIAAGAPAPDSPPAQPASLPTAQPEAREAVSPTPPLARRALGWLGKFHLLVLHFPIALLAGAGVGELWAAWKGVRVPLPAVRYCLYLGAAAAIPTVALGWLHALGGNGAGSPRLLSLHRWLGTTAGLVAVVAAILCERDARRGRRSRSARVLAPVACLLVALTGHFGGLMAHGQDFFDW